MAMEARRALSLEELGARSWFNHFPRQARSLNITNVLFNTSTDLQRFCTMTECTQTQLREWGRNARELGYSKNTTSRFYELGNGTTVAVLRSIKDNWRRIDGTMPQDKEDTSLRYTRGPKWNTNSCAMDATLFCALRLDVGRTQIDQLPISDLLELGPVSRFMREVVSKYWGTEDLSKRNKMRDALLKLLTESSERMNPAGHYQGVVTVVEECFKGLAQLSYTSIKAEVCCDGIVRVTPGTISTRRHLLELSPDMISQLNNIQGVLRETFGPRPMKYVNGVVTQCSRGHDCKETLQQRKVVLDRMPPVLMVSMPNPITKRQEVLFQAFTSLNFEVQGPIDAYQVCYEPLGCIMFQDKNHFTVCWTTDRSGEEQGKKVFHDGMVDDQAKYVDDWYYTEASRRTRSATRDIKGSVVMFYSKTNER